MYVYIYIYTHTYTHYTSIARKAERCSDVGAVRSARSRPLARELFTIPSSPSVLSPPHSRYAVLIPIRIITGSPRMQESWIEHQGMPPCFGKVGPTKTIDLLEPHLEGMFGVRIGRTWLRRLAGVTAKRGSGSAGLRPLAMAHARCLHRAWCLLVASRHHYVV